MVCKDSITGKYVSLRSVEENDASFILNLRLDKTKNKFVNAVDNDIDKEINWIRAQRKRDGDYFFSIIRNSEGVMLGNISIYNIDESQQTAELGRWMSYGASVENVEAALLAHDFAFCYLGMEAVYTKTLQDNSTVISFWKHFGGDAEENKEFEGRRFYYNVVRKRQYLTEIRGKYSRFFDS